MNRRNKYNTFVLDFLKKHCTLEVQQKWCSVDNQIAFKKIRLEIQQSTKKCPSSFLLFCKDHRAELQKSNPCWPFYLIMKELGRVWRMHKKENSLVFQQYTQLYRKHLFFKHQRVNIASKYSYLSTEEIDTIVSDMYSLSLKT